MNLRILMCTLLLEHQSEVRLDLQLALQHLVLLLQTVLLSRQLFHLCIRVCDIARARTYACVWVCSCV